MSNLKRSHLSSCKKGCAIMVWGNFNVDLSLLTSFSEYVLLLEAVPMAGASKFSLHKLRLTIIRSLRLVYALDRVNWLNLLYAPCGGGGGGDIEDWLAIDFLGIYAPWQLSFFYYYSFYLSWILIRCLIAIMVHLARVGLVFGLPIYCQSFDHSG